MDIWLLLSMMFVALAVFEYAILLGIRFGNGKKIQIKRGAKENKEMALLCKCADRVSLRMFMGIYILIVGSYFITVATHNN